MPETTRQSRVVSGLTLYILRGYGETADAPGLGPGVRKDVGVQLPLPAPKEKNDQTY